MQDVQSNTEYAMTPLDHTIGVVMAYVANNHVQPADLPDLIQAVHTTFVQLGHPSTDPAEPAFQQSSPAAIRRSITPDALISFIDGKPYKTLKRHLAKHGLDHDSYRARYGLPANYPATSAIYSATRAELARSLGLGRNLQRRRQTAAVETDVTPSADAAPKRRGRPPRAA